MNVVEKFVHSDVRKMNVVEKFVHSDVRKMNDIWFSRYLFLEQLNYQGSRSLSLYRLCLNSLHYTLVFQQRNSNLIQSGFVVCACYRRILTGSLRMSAKCGTLKGFGFKKARPIDDGKIWKKKMR